MDYERKMEYQQGPPPQQYASPSYGAPYQQPMSPHGQPAHYNTTVVTSQPAVTIYQPGPIRPNNHLALAIITCLLCFFPTGIAAIICSVMSSDAANAGDYETAQSKGRASLFLSIAGIIVGVVGVIILLIVYFTVGFGYYYVYG